MQVAVTGGSGCMGRPLVDKLVSCGIDVRLLALPEDPLIGLPLEKIRIVRGDLNSSGSLRTLTQNCEIVFHLAGKVHSFGQDKTTYREFYQNNVEGTRNLLSASRERNVRRVVFYSTVSVYGRDFDFFGDELSPCRPCSAYGQSKYLAEQLVLNSHKYGGPEGVALRFPVAYGPYDRGNVARLIRAVESKLFCYFGDGKGLRSMVSSSNAAIAAFNAGLEPLAANELFCVTDVRDYTLRELVETICHVLRIGWRPPKIPLWCASWLGKVGDVLESRVHVSVPLNSANVKKLTGSLTFSCDKAKKLLAYVPFESLMDGIRREIHWLKTGQ